MGQLLGSKARISPGEDGVNQISDSGSAAVYTWHTNRDTYDKIVFDDLKENATLAAMLAYMASEDPEHMSREKATLPISQRTGQPLEWVECRSPRRTSGR